MLEILINDESLEVQAKSEHLSLYPAVSFAFILQQSDDSTK